MSVGYTRVPVSWLMENNRSAYCLCPSEEQLRQHVEGRRHLAALQRVETARRSVYVRGFPPAETKYSDIKSLFEQFGSVVQVALDDKKVYPLSHSQCVDVICRFSAFCYRRVHER